MLTTPLNVVAFVPVWGKSRSGRGQSNIDKAEVFLTDHPPGTVLPRIDFCAWAEAKGYLGPAPSPSNKGEWLQYRHMQCDLLKKIRHSAASPQMQGILSGPYRITGGRGKAPLCVEALDEKNLLDPDRSRPIETLIHTVKQKYQHELQSVEWVNLSPGVRHQAEEAYRDFQYLEEDFDRQRRRNCDRLERTLRMIEQERNARQMQLALAAPENDDGLGIDAPTMDDLGL